MPWKRKFFRINELAHRESAMKFLDRLPAAVVQIPRPETHEFVGLGFLAPSELVITAAHNLSAPESRTGLYSGDSVPLKVSSGHLHRMEPIFVDQCQDVAVLQLHEYDFCEDHSLSELEPIPVLWNPIDGIYTGNLWTPDSGEVPVRYRVQNGPLLELDAGRHVPNGTC
jgi:hypothetical protein